MQKNKKGWALGLGIAAVAGFMAVSVQATPAVASNELAAVVADTIPPKDTIPAPDTLPKPDTTTPPPAPEEPAAN